MPLKLPALWLSLAACHDATTRFHRVDLPDYRQSSLESSGRCLTSDTICEPEHFTGGAALGDVNDDGFIDVVVTRIGMPPLLLWNDAGRFQEAALRFDDAVQSNGAALFDADVDGDLDLYVTVLGRPDDPPNDRYYFYENLGGRFAESAESRGLAFRDGRAHGGTSISVGDFDRDGLPDLHLTEWRAPTELGSLGHPHERLMKNEGAGSFSDVTLRAGVFLAGEDCRIAEAACQAYSFASALTDFDRDGAPDLAVTADFGRSRLFWGRGDGTFEDGTDTAGVGTDDNGMGMALGDYDGDGDLDWFVSGISDDPARCLGDACYWDATGNRLYRNEGDRAFTDVTDEVGVRDGGWGWGAAFFDYDLDADLDLVMTGGIDVPRYALDDSFADDRMRVWRNDGGRFTEVADELGLGSADQGRGLCVLDVDNDGDEDLFVVRHGERAVLYRNDQDTGHAWLVVRAYHDAVAAYGARITVRGSRTQAREVGVGAHFLCSPDPSAHFGLGGDERVEVEVRWPSGEVTTEVTATRRVLELHASGS